MNHEILINNLNHSGANVRLGVARVIGTVEETAALDALRAHYDTEQDLDVRSAILWAGRRVKAAADRGYTTLDALFTHFGIFKELRELGDPDEAAKLRSIQSQFENDLLRQTLQDQERLITRNAQQTGLSLLLGSSGGLIGAGLGAGSTTPMVDFGPSGPSRTEIGAKRAPATMPTKADISRPLNKLRESHDPSERRRAVIQLGELNNTAALPYLAEAFVADADDEVKQMAERWAKLIYWGAIYWRMEQEDTLEQMMREKAAAMREQNNLTPDQSLPIQHTPLQQQEDLDDILRRAEERRKRRK